MLKLIAGFSLLIVGGVLALPGVPGPGIAIVLLGLFLLSERFAWAARALAWCRSKLPHRGGTGQEAPAASKCPRK